MIWASLRLLVFIASLSSLCAQQNIITTFAGTRYKFTGDGGRAIAATLGDVRGVAVDRQGTVYFTDPGNDMVMKFGTSGTAIVTVLAGDGGFDNREVDGVPATRASLDGPTGIAVDSAGSVYFSEPNRARIRRVSPDGMISTIATGLAEPHGLAIGASGNLLVAESARNRVVSIGADGGITVIAGAGQSGFGGDGGPATAALFDDPRGVAVDRDGSILITDSRNHRIRRVSSDGVIRTIAGTERGGFNGDGPALSTQLAFPTAITVDSAGAIFIADTGGNRVRVLAAGRVTTLAGTGTQGFRGDNTPAAGALLDDPNGVAVDLAGNVFIADSGNQRIRRISASAQRFITTVAGNGQFGASGDGGPAAAASFLSPAGLHFDTQGNLYVADPSAHRVRHIDPAGIITTFAGTGRENFTGDGEAATRAAMRSPVAVASDSAGNVYIADASAGRIRRVGLDGIIDTFAGSADSSSRQDGIPARNATIGNPFAMVIDASDTVHLIEYETRRVRRIDSSGIITTVLGSGDVRLNDPRSLTLDGQGNLYIGDTGRVLKLSPDGSVATVAGTGVEGDSGDGGPAVNARISTPHGLAFDRNGNLFISDSGNNKIRFVSPSGTIALFAGTGDGNSYGDGGPALLAAFDLPEGIVFDSQGNLYVADNYSSRIRRILAAPPSFNAVPSTLAFSARAEGVPTPTQDLTLTGPFSGPEFQIDVETADGSGWLFASATTGPLPSTIQVFADPAGLSPGTYRGTITARIPFASPPVRMVQVTFNVGASDLAAPSADPTRLSFSFVTGASASSRQLRVGNAGGGFFEFQAEPAGAPWLSVTPSRGVATPANAALLSVTADPSRLSAGTFTGAIRIVTSTGQTLTIPVTATVSPREQTLLLSQSGVSFTAVVGGAAAPPQTFGVLNTGRGVMNWTAQSSTVTGGNWLSVTPDSGSTDATSTDVPVVSVNVDASLLAAGDYYGSVLVTSPGAANSPQTVTVVLNVLPAGSDPGPLIRPTGLIFAGVAGANNPAPQSVTITNLTAAPISFISGRLSSARSALFTHQPAESGVAPGQPFRITVTPDLRGAEPGVYRGTLTLQFNSGTARTVSLLFLVLPPPGSAFPSGRRRAEGCTPSQLFPLATSLAFGFSVPASWPVPLELRVVDDCGEPVTSGSVVASFSSGDPPLSLVSLKDGRWSGTWLARRVPSGAVTVTFHAGLPGTEVRGTTQVTGGVNTRPDAPIIDAGAIVSSADLARDLPLAPGALVTVAGTRLADSESSASSLPLPDTLVTTQVTAGGRVLPLVAVRGDRIDAQLPFDLSPDSRYSFVVQRGPTLSTVEEITVAAAQPAIFRKTPGSSQGVILRPDSSTAEPATPASAGETVRIRCSGLGAVTPAVPAGSPAPANNRVNATINVTIGSATAAVMSASMVPGSSGTYEVTVAVPTAATRGDAVPVVVIAGDRASAPATMAIR